MSDITDQIRTYRITGQGWPLLRDDLASRVYPAPERYLLPRDESNDLVPYTDGTWYEVRRCRN